jgi:hypothetical protein
MTAVLAVLLVLGAVVLCVTAWRTRGHEPPGIPDREAGALTAWDPAELREWTLELHHTKSTPPWPPLPHPDAAAGSQGGGHAPTREDDQGRAVRVCANDSRPAARADLTGSLSSRPHQEGPQPLSAPPAEGTHAWLAAPTPASQPPAAGMVAGENPARLPMGHETPAAGDPVTHDLWDHGPDEWTTRLVPAAEAPAAQDWAAALPPMSERLRQGLRDAEDAQRWPDLQHGYGFADGTGTFTRIVEDGEVA